MDNLNDLKAIWQTAKTDDLPKSAEMLRLVKKFRNQRLFKKILLIVLAILLLAVMVFVMFIYKSTMLTTRIGEALFIIACVILVVTNTRSLKRFIDLKDCSNKEFIEFLEQTRRNQVYFYTRTQVIALSVCSLGLLLYPYEFAHVNMDWFIGTYTFVVLYLGIIWLIVRPRVFKKEARKLNETLERLEKISNQIK